MLAKSKLSSIEVLVFKALIDSVISQDKFVLKNNVLKEYNEIKEEIKKFKDLSSSSKILVYLSLSWFHQRINNWLRENLQQI